MKQKLLWLSIILLLANMVWAIPQEEKRVVIHKEFINGDSLKGNLIWQDSDYDFDFEIDSAFSDIVVKAIPRSERKAARIVIKKSGFFSKSKIIIDYDPHSLEILKVVDNGDEIADRKFHKYQDYLEDATEFSELEALTPMMEDVELKIEMMDLPDSQKLEDLNVLLLNLEDLKSQHALLKKEHYMSVKKVIKLDNLMEKIKDVLSENGVTPPKEVDALSITKGKFYLNGEEIPGAVGQECIRVYADHSDLTVEELTKAGGTLSKDISVQITFD